MFLTACLLYFLPLYALDSGVVSLGSVHTHTKLTVRNGLNIYMYILKYTNPRNLRATNPFVQLNLGMKINKYICDKKP
jgi:hypothetical protein